MIFRKGHAASSFYPIVISYVAVLVVWYIVEAPASLRAGGVISAGLILLRLGIELVAAFYVVSTLLKCLDYLFGAPGFVPGAPPGQSQLPRVGIVYLCCDDLDLEAFESLCRLDYQGPLEMILHDDGRGDPQIFRAKVTSIAAREGLPMTLLRRPRREGGKPGAVNYLLKEVGDRFDFLLLCDNDSTALDPSAIQKGLRYFEDPTVAAVQFRGRGVANPHDTPLRRRLARAIDVFDLFASHQSRHGMMPFLGHNGLVRVNALLEAGGFTPGFLSDDIDVSVRWYLSGKRVAYARDIEFAEKAPACYAAFRLRARKWAFGCGQVLRRHGLRVLLSKKLSMARRLGFLEFVGFYAAQLLLAAYLIDSYILIPLLAPSAISRLDPAAPTQLAGAVVMAAVFLPTLAFCLKERRLAEWPALAWTCCLVYGSTSFETCRGIMGGLARRRLEWTPTNGRIEDSWLPLRCWAEFSLGMALFFVPLVYMPTLLVMPISYLFVANYLFSPIILACYQEPSFRQRAFRPLQANALPVVLVCILLALATACLAAAPALGAEVRVEGPEVLVDGRPFLLKGIHYSPWLPGTGPGKQHTWPDSDVIARDLDMIRSLHANTILIYEDAPPAMLDRAAERGLMVLQAFWIDWQMIHEKEPFARRSVEIVRRVEQVKDKPNLLGLVLGHEVTEWVYDQRGPELIAGRIESLARSVRQADPAHPITHANWPITKDLKLPSLDIVSFNVYPLWPREVVVRGYEEYIRDVLKPLAGGRPLWITEFGLNTLESTPEAQAETLKRCWVAIARHASGGIVFSFVDEWWKNFDNPIRHGKYWEREHAPDDEASHDLDPEEYYGIVNDQRVPKPAYAAVARMYKNRRVPAAAYFVTPLVLLMAYTIYVFTRRA